MRVSVVLPTYEEARNIVDLIRAIIENIPAGWAYEVIVADDNSPDQTYEVVRAAFETDPWVVPLLRTADRGLAKAIRCGIEAAHGEQILVMDSDFTHDPVEIPKLLHVAEKYDIVSASRFCPGGNMQDTKHYLASLLFNWFVRGVIRTQVQDNLGGYFTMARRNLDLLPWDRIFFGYGDYFFRLLHHAQRQDLTIVEVPARYRLRDRGESKSNFGKLLFKYTAAVLQLRARGLERGATVEKS
jgi:dolichol-phosphate mannosyltransferase